MGNNKVRWAILGAGKIAHKFAHDFKWVKDAELLAVASKDKDRATQFAAQYEIPEVLNYEQLYASEDIDVVYIATTHNFHFEQTLACLHAGKAVLCEKPITINAAQFRELAAVAQQKQLFLMEAMWTYFLPAMQRAKEWVRAGRIGAVKLIQADFGYRMEYLPEGRLYNPLLAGGALLDLGIYPIAFSTFFMDRKPDAIRASGVLTHTGVDATTGMVLQYGNATAVLSTTMLATTLNSGYIFGEEGYIEVPDFFKAKTVRLFNSNHELIETFTDDRESWGYNFETQEVTNCLHGALKQCAILPHSRSQQIHEIMTEVRRQIGLKYPMEREK